MGVKSVLGKIGKAVVPFIPGVGPIASAALGAVEGIASGASKGRAAGRVAEAGVAGDQDRLRLQAAQALEQALQGRAGLDLQRRRFQLQAPGQRGRTSVQGDVLANAQDARVGGPITRTRGRMPQISGGLRPSLMSGVTRQLGSELSRQALLSQMAGDQFESMPPPSMPAVTPLPQAGGFDKFLNILGGVGAGVGALDQSGLFDRWKAPKPPIPQIPLERPMSPRVRMPTFVDPRTYGGTPRPGVRY